MRLVTLSVVAFLFACRPESASAAPKHPTAADAATRAPLIVEDLPDGGAIATAIRTYYTKYEFRIPMRDGKKLFTQVYAPKDGTKRYPILLRRTPYSIEPYGVDNYPLATDGRVALRVAPSVAALKSGFIFAHQDVRGRMMSEGDFVDVRPVISVRQTTTDIDETTDTFDTIGFLVRHLPRNNGRVGMWGISYPGFYAAQGLVGAHPALAAVSPQAPVTDWFNGDDFHHNGAFCLADAFLFYRSFGRKRPVPTMKESWDESIDAGDAYDFFLKMGPIANANRDHLKGEIPFWNDLMEHETRDGFWEARDPRPHYRAVKPAVMTVGGWFDAEDLFGALETYRAIERQSPGATNTLVMGPWRHGGWARGEGDKLGDIPFGAKTSKFYQETIELGFFERHLKGLKGTNAPEAWVFGTGVNEWRQYEQWPPVGTQSAKLFFREDQQLAWARAGSGPGVDAYVSDPRKPVPHIGKPVETTGEYMNADQRFAARRPDVLVYAGPELDADVTLVGPLVADLWVTTTGTDADFVVKVIDVYPHTVKDPEPNPEAVRLAGYQQLVRAEIMRGKFRNSLAKPEPFVPGQVARVRFSLPDVHHTFRTGHRIMVQVQSSWFPLMDRNPQTFVNIRSAKEDAFQTATHSVFRSGDMPSGIEVQVLPSKVTIR